jgi:hypothetical protein
VAAFFSGHAPTAPLLASSNPASRFTAYPFLFRPEGSPGLRIVRSNAVRPDELDHLETFLDPMLNPINKGVLSPESWFSELRNYLDKGPQGAQELYKNHVMEATYLGKNEVNLVASWWSKNAPSGLRFGDSDPEKLRFLARATVGPETPLLTAKGQNEVQLFVPPTAVDWFLDIDGKFFQVTDRQKFTSFIRPAFQRLFGGYEKLSDNDQAEFWQHEMKPRYHQLRQEIEDSLQSGRDVGLQPMPRQELEQAN